MSIVRRIANLFSRSKLDQEIDAELRSHIEMRVADNLAAGMTAEQARRDALLRFGNRSVLRERVAAADTEMVLDTIIRDLRYAARQLRRSPGFTLTAVLTLALAIGANVVAFGVLNATVLNHLDVPQPAGLYNVVQGPHADDNQSYPNYLDYRRLNTTFRDLAAYRLNFAGISTEKWAIKSMFAEASGNYFDLLGARPELGRLFHETDEHGPNSAPYIVLSDTFWRVNFHADPGIIGTTVEVDKHPFTVIGVAPSSFHGTDAFLWPDFWMPIVNEEEVEGYDFLTARFNQGTWVVGKLKPGVTVSEATANLNAIAGRLAKQYPTSDEGMHARLVRAGLMGDLIGDPTRAFVSAVVLLAFLVLVAACANLASLFAARTADRSRELAVRLAMGGSRSQILRQLLTETLLVSLIGGAVGTVFAALLLRQLSHWQPFAEYPIHMTVVADARVYLVALALSAGSGLLFGLLPMQQLWRTSPIQAMKAGATSIVVFRRFALRDLLLGVQIAVCAVLVMACLVAFQGMQRSLHAPIGFQPEGAVLVETDLRMVGRTDDTSLPIQKGMLEEIARLPGVLSVGTVDELPLGVGGNNGAVYPMGTTDFRPSNSAFEAKYYSISPNYFQAAGTRLLTGRDFTWSDGSKSPRVAIINQTFARWMFPNASATGLHFLVGSKTPFEIVGVVEDGKYDSLTEDQQAAVFFPLAQQTTSETSLVVRSHLSATELAPMLNSTLRSIDPNLPFVIHTWTEALALVLFPARVATVALGIIGVLAAMLAVTGIFGMATYSVSRRMRELGIRVALGARPVRLIGAALGRPLILLLIGSGGGLVVGAVATRFLAQIVYLATPRDPLVFAGVVATMTLLGLLAMGIPAHRALRIHPARLLRED